MPLFDLPLAELRAYSPDLAVAPDLDAFWARTLDEARAHPLEPTFTPVDTGLTLVDTFDVTFRGFGGQPVKGWLHLPAGSTGPLPRWSSTSATAAAAACPTSGCCSRQRATRTWSWTPAARDRRGRWGTRRPRTTARRPTPAS